MDRVETLKIKATHSSQGEWVVINAADFDPQTMQRYEPEAEQAAPLRRGPGRPPKLRTEDANR